MKHWLVLLLSFFLLTACGSGSAEPLPPSAHIGGGLEAFVRSTRLPQWPIAVYGETAFLGERDGLTILDVSDPTQPVRVGGQMLPDYLLRLEVQDDHLYALHRSGLTIFALDDPAQPGELAAYEFSRAVDMILDGEQVYLLGESADEKDDPYQLHVVSLADPARPKRTQQVELTLEHSYPAVQLFQAGDLLCVAEADWWSGGVFLHCASLGAGEAIEFTMNPSRWNDAGGLALFETQGQVYAAVVDLNPGLQIVRLPDFTPVAAIPLAEDIDTAMIRPVTMLAAGDTLYLAAHDDHIWPLSVADPVQPQWGAPTDPVGDGEAALSLALAGGRLYAGAEGAAGLTILGADGRRLGSYRTLYMPHAVAWVGDQAYVLDRVVGLQIVSLADLENPYVLGAAEFEDAGGRSLAVDGDMVYLEAQWALHVIDASDPRAPVERSVLEFSGPITDVAAFDQTAYLAMCSEGVFVINAADPDAPAQTATLPSQDCSWSLLVHEGRLYIADGDGGLAVFSLADPVHPQQVGRQPWPAEAPDLEAAVMDAFDDYLYISYDFSFTEATAALLVFSLADPDAPQLAASVEKPHLRASDLAVSENWLYVTDERNLFWVFDIDDPSRPRLRRQWSAVQGGASPYVFAVSGVAAQGRRAVVVSEDLGMYVFELP